MKLVIPQDGDYAEWAALRKSSADYLRNFEPTWASDEFSADRFRRRIKAQDAERARDQGYAFFIRGNDGKLVGGLTLGPVRRGFVQSAALGVWVGNPFAGRGYGIRATKEAVRIAFDVLRLHRVEAACLLDNAASIRVLKRLGFTREGTARSYAKINGAWRDHYLWAIVNEHDA